MQSGGTARFTGRHTDKTSAWFCLGDPGGTKAGWGVGEWEVGEGEDGGWGWSGAECLSKKDSERVLQGAGVLVEKAPRFERVHAICQETPRSLVAFMCRRPREGWPGSEGVTAAYVTCGELSVREAG